MKYNKNIVLNILSSEFFDPIEEYTTECIWEMDGADLCRVFDMSVDYAELDYIDGLYVSDYDIEEDEEGECISGTLEVSAYIEGYVHWDGENVNVKNEIYEFVMYFQFYADGDEYSNLSLEHVY